MILTPTHGAAGFEAMHDPAAGSHERRPHAEAPKITRSLSRPMRVLVTGANGFVGRALVSELLARGHHVAVAVRTPDAVPPGTEARSIGDLARVGNWNPALASVDAVAHLAARVHVAGPQDQEVYRAANVAPTLRLAEAAAAAGVRRFVFLSSIKAMGEKSVSGRPLTETDLPTPLDAYGLSKLEAERSLAGVAARTGLDVVSLRPPLVHGPGVRANFLNLLRWIDKGVPVPVTAENRRSLIAVHNLASAIVAVLEHQDKVAGTYLVADRPAISTAELVRQLAVGMGRQARMVSVPAPLVSMGAALPVIGPRLSRLTGNLELDDSLFRRTYGWSSTIDSKTALQGTAAWYAELINDRNRAGSSP